MLFRSIPKPAYNAFALLHRLGDRRLPVNSDSALVTKRQDGTIVIALWNYAPPPPGGTDIGYTSPGLNGPAKSFVLSFPGHGTNLRAKLWRLDRNHGSVIKIFDVMGRPAYPTPLQIVALREAAKQPAAEAAKMVAGTLVVDVPTQGLTLVELQRAL